jgi:hypothetical protein
VRGASLGWNIGASEVRFAVGVTLTLYLSGILCRFNVFVSMYITYHILRKVGPTDVTVVIERIYDETIVSVGDSVNTNPRHGRPHGKQQYQKQNIRAVSMLDGAAKVWRCDQLVAFFITIVVSCCHCML